MPRYLVLDPELLKQAIIADKQVADPLSAVQAIGVEVGVPPRVVVIRAGSLDEFLVVDDDGGNPPPQVVVRDVAPINP